MVGSFFSIQNTFRAFNSIQAEETYSMLPKINEYYSQSSLLDPTISNARSYQPNAPILQTFTIQRCQNHYSTHKILLENHERIANSKSIEAISDGYDDGGLDEADLMRST
ncbi:hypothetical protein RND71_032262 [Anisodus tanguticus]|uniref:Uncharacterized protein n=1 Tax=Anisodus tanguticus TaxID=243964 RepID=A0AAE1UZP6_9SOLA|nr:hypothetical protein RND71_032262 [Anisodus tanguticus]